MSKEEVLDAVIVGGGPAGTAVALALAQRGLSAAVLERSSYAAVRIGESVPPEIGGPLRELDLWDRFQRSGHQVSYGSASVWGSPEVRHSSSMLSPWGEGWHLDRNRFDAMLAAACEEAGIVLRREAHAQAVTPCEEGWRVSGRWRGQPFAVRGRYLVDATGRAASLVRKLGGRRRACDRLIGATGYLEPGPAASRLAATTLVEAVEDGWWYSAPLPGGKAVAAFFTEAGSLPERSARAVARWWERLQAAEATCARLRGFLPPEELHVRLADSALIGSVPRVERFLAVGDAAMSLDPLSSQGILKALRSGLRAARALAADHAGCREALPEYWEEMHRAFRSYLDLRSAKYRQEGRWPESPFWRPRLNSEM